MQRPFVELGQPPFVELDADVALDPGKSVVLTDGHQHLVAFEVRVGLAGRDQAAPSLFVEYRAHLLEGDAGKAAAVVGKCLGDEIVEDRDAFVHRVFLFPGTGLHLLETRADDDLDVFAAEPSRRTTAVHRRIATAENDDTLADRGGMPESDAGQPVDAEMDVLGRGLATGDVEIMAAWCSGADEDRVITFGKQVFQ